jgi:hypothetical protein
VLLILRVALERKAHEGSSEHGRQQIRHDIDLCVVHLTEREMWFWSLESLPRHVVQLLELGVVLQESLEIDVGPANVQSPEHGTAQALALKVPRHVNERQGRSAGLEQETKQHERLDRGVAQLQRLEASDLTKSAEVTHAWPAKVEDAKGLERAESSHRYRPGFDGKGLATC